MLPTTAASDLASSLPRILFVDDEPFVLSAIQRQMSAFNSQWDIAFANGGSAALEAMEVRPADVVVTDMVMPKMDGAALIDRLNQCYPNTVSIVLSGHWPQPPKPSPKIASHVRILTKPVSTDVLVSTIKSALNDARPATAGQ